MSLHPTTTDDELAYILDAIEKVVVSRGEWSKDYSYDRHRNEFLPVAGEPWDEADLERWFDLENGFNNQ
jgi:hypothetical protein